MVEEEQQQHQFSHYGESAQRNVRFMTMGTAVEDLTWVRDVREAQARHILTAHKIAGSGTVHGHRHSHGQHNDGCIDHASCHAETYGQKCSANRHHGMVGCVYPSRRWVAGAATPLALSSA